MPRTWISLSGAIALSALAGCASEPEPIQPVSTTAELPALPDDDRDAGLDRALREERLQPNPNPIELPEPPADRDLGTFLEHAMERAVFDLDQPAPSRPAQKTDRAPLAANTSASIETQPGPLGPLVGAPPDPFVEDGAPAETEDPVPAEPAEVATEQSIDDVVRLLQRLLADELEASDLPMASGLRLASLESLEPGALERILTAYGLADVLTPEERAVLSAWAGLHGAVDDADPELVALALEEAASATGSLLPMRIARLELCTSVEGFGSFTALHRYGDRVLVRSGEARRMIVYAELAHFASTPSTKNSVDGFEVDLRQELELVHLDKGDGSADLVAWRQPEERIVDFSRNRRRDFYTIQIIELPSTLTIGRYHLRLTVRDAGSGEQAQAVVPIDVVTQPDPDAIEASVTR